MNPTLKKEITKTFIKTIKDLVEQKKIDQFLDDFLTEGEIEEFARRLAISYWIRKGRDDENIQRNLKATKKEIEKAKDTLQTKGIEAAIKNLEADEWANVWAKRIKKISKI